MYVYMPRGIGMFPHQKEVEWTQNFKFWRLFGSVISFETLVELLTKKSGFQNCLETFYISDRRWDWPS